MTNRPLKIFLSAGEASADLLGSLLLAKLKSLFPGVSAYGVGGKHLESEGLEVVVAAERISIVGVTTALKQLPDLLGCFKSLVERCRKDRPDVAVLLDLPDFNLRLAKKLKRMGIPVVYYISPQVWVWRKYRIKTIQKYVDKMLVLFPFEREFYEAHGVPVTFVGHPLVNHYAEKSNHRAGQSIRTEPRLALLPGSRRSEIEHHCEVFEALVARLLIKYPKLQIRLPIAPTLSEAWMRKRFTHPRISLERAATSEILTWSDLAVVASGTATLETALVTSPCCFLYKVSRLNEYLFYFLVRWKGSFGMPNLLLGKPAIQEFFQDAASAESLEKECERIICDDEYRLQMVGNLRQCRTILGGGDASERAAQEIALLVNGK